MSLSTETVAALATASGPAGIAVVRISGPAALAVADRLVRCAGKPPSQRPGGRFFHARFLSPVTGEMLDDGLVLVSRTPHSFTGEDVVELQGHGGVVVSQRLLQAVFAAGAAPAGAGEFTRRAFLNGRLDLTQAEAVADLIQAQTSRAARVALEQAHGALRRHIDALYEQLLAICADVEAMLDFDEGELDDSFLRRQRQALEELVLQAQRLLDTRHEGLLLRRGLRVVIAGRVNAGKSSLLNALLGTDRAIVTDVPGTTRDTIEEGYSLDGVPLRLTDTAGMRETADKAELAGVQRTRQALEQADIVIYMIDGTQPIDASDREKIASLDAERLIIAVNKSDLPNYRKALPASGLLPPDSPAPIVACHTLDENGARSVVEALRLHIGKGLAAVQEGVPIAERHYHELTKAVEALREAAGGLNDGNTMVVAALNLRQAAEAIGRITGRVYSEDLLDTVFARFCIGK